MLIDSKKLEQAKQTIASETPDMIAGLMNLQMYDPKNHKSLCPFHNEDTPSFVWDPKRLRFMCFAKGTRVITKYGVKNIETLVGKNVEIINGNGEWESVMFHYLGEQPLMDITLAKSCKTKHIYATPEHEWIVKYRKHKVQTKDLKVGYSLESMWYQEKSAIIPSKNGMIHGFIYGDGSSNKIIYSSGRERYRHVLNIFTESKYKFCSSLFEMKPVCKSVKEHNPNIIGRVCFTNDTNLKEVPNLRDYSKEYLYGFLIGYFMADGNCTDESSVQIHSAKYEDLLKIRDIFTYVGIPSYPIGKTIRTSKNSNMGICTTTKDEYPLYVLRLVSSCIKDNFFTDYKKPKTKPQYTSYLGWRVESINETNRVESVYCCETSTHSFTLEDFILTGNCFGCHATVDIVDAYMSTGLTFIDACEQVFEKAGIVYPLGEKGVRTQPSYKYPHEEPINDKETITNYFNKRCISRETLDYCDVREDSKGNAVFNFYDTNDVLTMVKYKPSHKIDKTKQEIKSWCQKGADTTPLLFNMNRVNPNQPLLITEGEADTLAAIESGYKNSVSVPLGANNYGWIEQNWEFLEQFNNIILAFDNDEAGIKATKEVIYRLGTWRTSVMNIPEHAEYNGKTVKVKDINELLFYKGKNAVIEAIVNAKDAPVQSVVDFSSVEDIDIDKMDGIYTGFKEVDKVIGKIFYSMVTIVSGLPSSGKSSFLNQIISNVIDSGEKVWIFSKEMNANILSNWLTISLAGSGNLKEYISNYTGAPYYKIPQETKEKIRQFYEGQLFIYKDDAPNDEDSLFISMEECVRKFGTRTLIIDNLMCIALKNASNDKYEAQTDFFNRLLGFAKKYNVAIVIVCHPKKLPAGVREVDMYDISGSSNIINLAHLSFALRRISKKEKENYKCPYARYDVLLSIIKDRIQGRNNVDIPFYYDNPSRRFYTNFEEYKRDFKWDDLKANASLKMPEKLKDYALEIYGDDTDADRNED